MPALRVPESEDPFNESLCLRVNVVDSVLLILVIYFKCNRPLTEYLSFYKRLLDSDVLFSQRTQILILGDFNLSTVCFPIFSSDPKLSEINNFIEALDLQSFKVVMNQNNRTLDLVLSNNLNTSATTDNFPLVPVDSHHPPLNITFRVKSCPKFSSSRAYASSLNFAKANFAGLYDDLRRSDR